MTKLIRFPSRDADNGFFVVLVIDVFARVVDFDTVDVDIVVDQLPIASCQAFSVAVLLYCIGGSIL